MRTLDDLAKKLKVSGKFLRYVLYGRRDRTRYKSFDIPKRSGGYRTISAPPRRLRWLQYLAYTFLLTHYKRKKCVHGFVKGQSIVSNASPHCRSRHIVNIDLKDFFPSIHFGRVRGVFLSPPFSFGEEAARVLAQICCQDSANGGALPQGGVTSPLLANLVCRSLDNSLIAFSKKHKLQYTRYADDLTFSSHRSWIPKELLDTSQEPPTPGLLLKEIIEKENFTINLKKFSCRGTFTRQEVTGLTVNRFPNVPRQFIKGLEGALHAWGKFGLPHAQEAYETKFSTGKGIRLDNVLKGRLAYMKMVRGEHDFLYRRLSRRYNRLASDLIQICSIVDSKPCTMHNLPCDWDFWIKKYRPEIFHLTFKNEMGDDRSGSAFHIGNGVVATARHNIISREGSIHDGLAVIVDKEKESVKIIHEEKLQDPEPDVGAVLLESLNTLRGIPTQLRIPDVGEEVVALGFPKIPMRLPTLVAHIGTVEALPTSYSNKQKYVQVSFQSGGGLSGGCLIDKSGHALGILVENVFMNQAKDPPVEETVSTIEIPSRAYGQALPMEYLDEFLAN